MSASPGLIVHFATSYGRAGETAAQLLQTNVTFPLTLAKVAADIGSVFINCDTALHPDVSPYAAAKKDFLD